MNHFYFLFALEWGKWIYLSNISVWQQSNFIMCRMIECQQKTYNSTEINHIYSLRLFKRNQITCFCALRRKAPIVAIVQLHWKGFVRSGLVALCVEQRRKRHSAVMTRGLCLSCSLICGISCLLWQSTLISLKRGANQYLDDRNLLEQQHSHGVKSNKLLLPTAEQQKIM